jgi:DNA helicase-2/ATP-dependent DNA helicase PcrA
MMTQDLLNPMQKEAIAHIEGPCLVLAGAGSGKTRIVTHRIAHLISLGVPTTDIVAVTFTNKAAEEMNRRVEKLCQARVLCCTFHSFGVRILRESIEVMGYKSNFTVFDEEEVEKVIKECFESLGIKEDKQILKSIRYGISTLKNQYEKPLEKDPLLVSIYNKYQEKMRSYNALDFDDLLVKTVELFENFPDVLEKYQKRFQFILIDEYQDTNKAQYTLIKLLSQKHKRVFAVGDPDQSIYSWRGACIENILNFKEDFPGAKVITLDQNYRSYSTILDAANALISHNQKRFEKKLWSDLGLGDKIGIALCDSDYDETDFVIRRLKRHIESGIDPNECVIFYRTNFQSRPFEDALLKEGIAYKIIGGLSFYQRREIKDILSYLRLVASNVDTMAFARTINVPKRGLGDVAVKKIKAFAEEHNLSILDAAKSMAGSRQGLSEKQRLALNEYLAIIEHLRTQELSLPLLIETLIDKIDYINYLKEDPLTAEDKKDNLFELVHTARNWTDTTETPTLVGFLEDIALKTTQEDSSETRATVKLMTLHNSKGLEFDTVFLVGMEEDLFPHINAKDNPSDIEEERRLCYVGMTRAKKHLYMSACNFRFLWGQQRMMRPSRFLAEIPENYLTTLVGRKIQRIESDDIPSEFSQGDRVYHKDFGNGTIRGKSQTSLGLAYDVFFDELYEKRTLVARFAKLLPQDRSHEKN